MYLQNNTFTHLPILTETLIPDYLLIPLGITVIGVYAQCIIISCYCIFWNCCNREVKVKVIEQINPESSPTSVHRIKTPIEVNPVFGPQLFFNTDSPTFTRETASELSNTNSPNRSPILTFGNKNAVSFHKSADSIHRYSPFSNTCYSTTNSREHWL